jgi:WD40 repeat protein
MKLATTLVGGLLVAVIASPGCQKDKESLIVVAITADSGASNLRTLTLSAQSLSASGGSKSFSINGLSGTPVSYGLYIPGDVTGDVTVSAVATDPASCMGYMGRTMPAVRVPAAGSTVQATISMKAASTCTPDGGAGGCNEYALHASSTCTFGDPEDIPIVTLAFSPDGRLLVTGAAGLAKVWTFSGNMPVAEGHVLSGAGFAVVGFSPDGTKLAVGWKGSVEVWNVSTWTKLQTLSLASSSNEAYDVGFSPDGQQVISIDTDGTDSTGTLGDLYVHAIGTPAPLQKASLTLPYALSVSPVAVAGGALAAVSDQTGQVSLYTVSSSGITPSTFLTATTGSTAYAVRFSPDGTMLAAASGGDGLVHFWNVPVTSATTVAPDIDLYGGSTGYSDDVYAVAFSADGRQIAVGGGFFGSISTWNVAAPRGLIAIDKSPTYDIQAIALAPSGMIAGGESNCGLVAICGN